MQNKLKPVFSLITIGLFLLLALASGGPDASTNTTVAITDCEPRFQAAGTLKATISVMNTEGEPIAGANVIIFIVHQEVKPPGDDCTFNRISSTDSALTGTDGTYTYNGSEYFHDNSHDLHRVEVVILQTPLRTGYKEVQVQYYNSADFNFKCVVKRLNEL